MRKRALRLVTVEPERLDVETESRTYQLSPLPGERVFVFVVSARDRSAVSQTEMERQRAAVGRLVAPHRAEFVVLDPGATMSVYEVLDP